MPNDFMQELSLTVSSGSFDELLAGLQSEQENLPWWSKFRFYEIKWQMDLTRLARRAYRAGFIACKAGRDCV
jgi:hypothetical protein